MAIELRDYQVQTVDSVFESYDKGIQRQLIVKATGLGKTITLIFIILRLLKQNKRVLILVDQEDLVWQWRKRIHSVDDSIKIGIEKAEYKTNKTDRVVIASVQTLGRKGNKRIKKFDPEQFDAVLVDEAHKSISESWFRVLNYFGSGNENFSDKRILVGCTATPYRSSGESLGMLYDDIIANYDIRYAIGQGWLTDIQVYDVKTSTDISHVKTNKDDFNQKQLAEAVDNEVRNEEIVKAYKQISDGEQCIVYCAGVQHAYRVAEMFRQNGISAQTIEANTDKEERKQWIKDFEDGKLRVLCNFGTLTTGIDFPELSTIILARPVKSKLLFTQIIGRVLRPSQTAMVDVMPTARSRKDAIEGSDKPFAKIIDLHDTTGRHNVAHIPSLFGLHNELQVKEPKRFFKEVVEPIEQLEREHQIDLSGIKNLDEINLIVKNRKYEISSLSLSPEIAEFTDRAWTEVGDNSYEIMYSNDNVCLIIDRNQSKDELLGKEEWNLLEYDMQTKVTKNLQTFNSVSGAFKIADEYADEMEWSSRFLKKEPWMEAGVTEPQMNQIRRYFRYKSGYSQFTELEERYDDTGLRKVYWKPTQEVLTRGTATKILQDFYNKKKK